MRSEEGDQLSDYLRPNFDVASALTGAEALVSAVFQSHAVESTRGIQIKLILAQLSRKSEKFFDFDELLQRIADKIFSTDQMYLIHFEVPEPLSHVAVVKRSSDGFVIPFHLSCLWIDGQSLEGRVDFSDSGFGNPELGIVGERPCNWISDDEEQFNAGIHSMDSFGNLGWEWLT